MAKKTNNLPGVGASDARGFAAPGEPWRKDHIFRQRGNPRAAWQCACYEFWEKPRFLGSASDSDAVSGAALSLLLLSTTARIGLESLNQGEAENERELYSAGSARTADCRTAASGLRQFGDCPTAQDGPAHGEGTL